jgi:hypothetical protein
MAKGEIFIDTAMVRTIYSIQIIVVFEVGGV